MSQRMIHAPETETLRRSRAHIEDDSDEDDDCGLDDESSEDDVDESVAEDMRKLDETFQGISRRYRLVNRIGEGDLVFCLPTPSSLR